MFKSGVWGFLKSLMHVALFLFQVNDIRVTKSGHLECYLEYIDYPGEGKQIFMLALFCYAIAFVFAYRSSSNDLKRNCNGTTCTKSCWQLILELSALRILHRNHLDFFLIISVSSICFQLLNLLSLYFPIFVYQRVYTIDALWTAGKFYVMHPVFEVHMIIIHIFHISVGTAKT